MKVLVRAGVFGLCCFVVGCLYGCGFLDMVTGINPDGTSSGGPSIVDSVGDGAKSLLGPWGAVVGLALGWGSREYRHHRLIAAGKKDDNRDGIEDAPKA